MTTATTTTTRATATTTMDSHNDDVPSRCAVEVRLNSKPTDSVGCAIGVVALCCCWLLLLLLILEALIGHQPFRSLSAADNFRVVIATINNINDSNLCFNCIATNSTTICRNLQVYSRRLSLLPAGDEQFSTLAFHCDQLCI